MLNRLVSWLNAAAASAAAVPLEDRPAVVLSGGGARAAYQAGVLQYVADHFSLEAVQIITGVSAGSINAVQLAGFPGERGEAVSRMVESWQHVSPEDIYEPATSMSLALKMIRRSSDEDQELLPRSGLVDTRPLRSYLERVLGASEGRLSGIGTNLDRGRLHACALVGTEYATGQSVTWVEGPGMPAWDRPNRIHTRTHLTVDHVMASGSLPFLFPAVEIYGHWFGDGGIRQVEPLSPAVHLGATRILAISTRYGRSSSEASRPVSTGYPPAAQIFGVLLNSVFLDRLDQDAAGLERVNDLIRQIPPAQRAGLREIDLLVIRPSVDLGMLSGEFQHDLGGVLRLIARGLGSSDTRSPDWLSMILFEPAYMQRLIEVGYRDGKAHHDALGRFAGA
ncbi:MAG: patatin-like phospholipase family protein [Bacteroidetes bacterium]|nr:patatin-like phospholipase family protein [Bacteroidota bacterium]